MYTKPFYTSKTFWFNLLVIVIAAAGVFGFGSYQPDVLTLEIAGVLIAALNILLRLVTSQAVR